MMKIEVMIPIEFDDPTTLPPPPRKWLEELGAETRYLFERCWTINEFRKYIIKQVGFMFGPKTFMIDLKNDKTSKTKLPLFKHLRVGGDLRSHVHHWVLTPNRSPRHRDRAIYSSHSKPGYIDYETGWLVRKGDLTGKMENIQYLPSRLAMMEIEGKQSTNTNSNRYRNMRRMGNRIFHQNRGNHDKELIKTLATKTRGLLSTKAIEDYWKINKYWQLTSMRAHWQRYDDSAAIGFAFAMLERYGNIFKIPNIRQEYQDWSSGNGDYYQGRKFAHLKNNRGINCTN